MITKFKLFELKSDENIELMLLDYINLQMTKDKKEYKGDIPTKYNKGGKWSDFSWLVDEIIMFLGKDGYVFRKFGKKHDYETLNDILKRNFKQEYQRAEEILNENVKNSEFKIINEDRKKFDKITMREIIKKYKKLIIDEDMSEKKAIKKLCDEYKCEMIDLYFLFPSGSGYDDDIIFPFFGFWGGFNSR